MRDQEFESLEMAPPAMSNNTEAQRSFENGIPVFDLSQLRQHSEEGHTPDLKDFYLKFRIACEEWGCFRVVNHGVGHDLLQSLDAACRDVFMLPKETKEKNFSAIPFHGYIAPSTRAPLYESLGISGAPLPAAIQRFCDQLWPLEGNSNFREIIQAYAYRMEELANDIHKIILASWGITKYYESHFSDCKGVLRFNRYVASEESPASKALVSHTDGGSLAILYEDNMGGLEILDRAGRWVAVPPLPDSFVVIFGDTLQAWSNKRCRSARHRVIVKEWKNRHSAAFFWLLPDEMEISAPPELVDEQHPRLYRPFLYSELGSFRAEQAGKLSKTLEERCPVDLFAGVSSYEQ